LVNSTSFTYNSSGLLQTTTDPLGNTTTDYYDGARRLTQTLDALGGSTSFTYDGSGLGTHRRHFCC
jgi:YD repeat-containing protein